MRNVRHLSGLDIEGGGQIVVAGEHAFVGHMQPPHGTSIIDVSDPARPVIKAHIDTGSAWSHTHKVRVCGDIMVTNVEQDRRSLLRNGQRWHELHARLSTALGREPGADEMATELGVDVADLAAVQAAAVRGYDEGGFGMHQFQEHLRSSEVYCAWFSGGLRVVDIAIPTEPREIAFFIPPSRAGQPSPQSNDVELDERGLVYLLDRNKGLDILEMSR